METVGQWVRRSLDECRYFIGTEVWPFFTSQFSIFLLFLWVVFMLFYVLHISHHASDKDLIPWSREITSGVIGALLGMLTGMKFGHDIAVRSFKQTPPSMEDAGPKKD